MAATLNSEIVSFEIEAPLRVTDLKQWVYCPRVLYYYFCLPDVRPTTYKMQAGGEAGKQEQLREVRRSLKAYGLTEGRREFNLPLFSSRLGLRGKADMVIWLDHLTPEEAIPVDYKLSEIAGEHFKLQLMAYGLLLEENFGCVVKRGFLYSIPRGRAEEVELNQRLRDKLSFALDAIHKMLCYERMPAATSQLNKCAGCEFRRFCNDVI